MRASVLARLADLLGRIDAPAQLDIHSLLACTADSTRPGIHNPSADPKVHAVIPSTATARDLPTGLPPTPVVHSPLTSGGSR
ncbi:hypothetical protein OG205_34920 [Lentzea sp. NBC_00516]|uniref:hypothetical protein n=1 Tax=Lentzea sp. NBC_00516 TaxID=2903582 RepID=UPI002E7FD7E4|nr:hypothetical protein [Lentzea sp. NBC_00516]WUD23217.1 hypothetical protein OG205_34920 [Lentzea sp. NBC_00516]